MKLNQINEELGRLDEVNCASLLNILKDNTACSKYYNLALKAQQGQQVFKSSVVDDNNTRMSSFDVDKYLKNAGLDPKWMTNQQKVVYNYLLGNV